MHQEKRRNSWCSYVSFRAWLICQRFPWEVASAYWPFYSSQAAPLPARQQVALRRSPGRWLRLRSIAPFSPHPRCSTLTPWEPITTCNSSEAGLSGSMASSTIASCTWLSVICRPLWQNPAGYTSQVHRRELLHKLCSSRHFGSGRYWTCLKVHEVEGQPMRVAHLVLVVLSEKQGGPLPRVGSRSRFESVERVKFREVMRDN